MIFAQNESTKHQPELRGAFLALLQRDYEKGLLEGMEYLTEGGQPDLCLLGNESNQKRLDHWHKVFKGLIQKPNATVPFDLRHVPEDFISFLQQLRRKAKEGGQQSPSPKPARVKPEPSPAPNVPPEPETPAGQQQKDEGGDGKSAA